MSAINLVDVTKNSKEVQRGLKEWEKANPAELIECMTRRGELKHLKAKEYDRAYKPRFVIRGQVEPDEAEGHGFKRGDRVIATPEGMASVALCGGITEGVVDGVKGPFVKVNGNYYAPSRWEKVTKRARVLPQ